MLDWGIQLLIDDRVDAVLFNLNGVLVATEKLHMACWKQAFDEVLIRESTRGFPARRERPFDADDYRRHVNGRPRHEGALAYLRQRGVNLPFGSPNDPPGNDTVCALANLKALRFRASLALRPPTLHPGARELATELKTRGYQLGLVSTSTNCEWMVRQLGIIDLFPVRLDGALAEDLGIPACPSPARLIETAKRLGTEPDRTAVLEDSIAGVRAARAGHFGWVIGVDRGTDRSALRAAGADVVISSLQELQPPVDFNLERRTSGGFPLPAR